MVTRRQFLAESAGMLLAGGGLAALMGCDAIQEPIARGAPNFVIILADDLGYGDLGCYGSTGISTPRLDAMASQGARFTDYSVSSPVCSQSRFGMMTGRYGIRGGIDHVLMASEHIGIPSSELTLGGALRDAGYRTGCIGKWHLGSDTPYLPLRHGFDYFYGLPHSNDMSPLPLIRGETVIQQSPDQALLTSDFTDEAIGFIKRSQDRSFLLYLAHTAPHVPLRAADAFRGTSARGVYGDVVEELDWSTGRILDTLTELGLDNRTLVLFTSDNGPWLEKGADAGSAGPFRGGKNSVYEGGIRMPFILRWPGRIDPGQTISEPLSALDVLPTVLTLAGGTIPRDRVIDGRYAWPAWSGKGKIGDRNLYFYVVGEIPLAVRSGRWKMHLAGTSRRLYDLSKDPTESTDVAGDNPEIVAALSDTTEKWRQLVEQQKADEAETSATPDMGPPFGSPADLG